MATANHPISILIIDDSIEDQETFRRLLRNGEDDAYILTVEDTGEAGLSRMHSLRPDCTFLDFNLPDMDGLEFLYSLKSVDDGKPHPIVMITGQGNEAIAVEAMKQGAQDYLVKDTISTTKIHLAIQNTMEKMDLIEQLDATNRKLEKMAFYDTLTGLGNRNLFFDRFQHALDVADRQGLDVSLLMIDLDDFKIFNDTLGHEAGDVILAETGRRFRDALRKADTVARLGGDEFAVILETNSHPGGIDLVAEKLLAAAREPIAYNGTMLTVGLSVGIATFPADGTSPDEICHHADMAMYQAKRGGGGVVVYKAGDEPRQAPDQPIHGGLVRAIRS